MCKKIKLFLSINSNDPGRYGALGRPALTLELSLVHPTTAAGKVPGHTL